MRITHYIFACVLGIAVSTAQLSQRLDFIIALLPFIISVTM